jgi:signal transduction histidine kinase
LLFAGGALLVVLAVGLADRLGRSIVRPLQALVTVANRLRDGDLTSRARPAGPYEVAEVALAVNDLAGRIDGLLASARLAAADLGHRLRTPLTALRLDVEALADESVTADTARSRLKDGLDDLEEAVNQLIQQTRGGAGHVPARSDLAVAVRDRMAFWGVLAKSQARATDVQLTSHRIEVSLGRDELDAAIDALLSNVFIHTPEGTGFKVILGRPRRGQSCSLVIENEAPRAGGAIAVEVPSAGSPERARAKGTGLGLDIVRRTAERAGGALTAGPVAGGGFRAELIVPRVV